MYKRVLLNQIDNDFINISGLIMNDMDETIAILEGNKRASQLQEGYFINDQEMLLIRMSNSNNGNSLFLLHPLSTEQDFWIKFCTSYSNGTIHPCVFEFDNTPYLPNATSVRYEDDDADKQSEILEVGLDVLSELYGKQTTKDFSLSIHGGIPGSLYGLTDPFVETNANHCNTFMDSHDLKNLYHQYLK